MPDISSNASGKTTRVLVALDVHKNAITAGVLPAEGGQVELAQLESSEKAIRRRLIGSAAPKGSLSVTRRARAATSCTGCSCRSAWRATSSC